MILVVDNYDSFTWNLVHYLAELGAGTRVVRNDEITPEEAWASKPRRRPAVPRPLLAQRGRHLPASSRHRP
jgi:Anthranilate/para-aminobenzoate synthases component II